MSDRANEGHGVEHSCFIGMRTLQICVVQDSCMRAGFCKQQLWPLFHYRLPLMPSSAGRFNSELWQAYVKANKVRHALHAPLLQLRACADGKCRIYCMLQRVTPDTSIHQAACCSVYIAFNIGIYRGYTLGVSDSWLITCMGRACHAHGAPRICFGARAIACFTMIFPVGSWLLAIQHACNVHADHAEKLSTCLPAGFRRQAGGGHQCRRGLCMGA